MPDGEEGGVNVEVTRGGGEGIATLGEGVRFCPGENEGWEEGLYRSSELTGEKARGLG